MGKRKKLRVRLKRFIRELETYDRMNDGKLSSALLAAICFLSLILIGICFLIFG